MKFVLLLRRGGVLAGPRRLVRPEPAVPVTPDNFPRAELDLYFASAVKDGGLGKFLHRREPTALDRQTVTRMNRDTLYSGAVFDLDAGPVTITLPDAGQRFMSMQTSTRTPTRPKSSTDPGRYDADEGKDRHALRSRRRAHLRRRRRSEGRRGRPRLAGRHQGRAAGRPRRLSQIRTGTRRPRSTCARR